jgi:thioredoxin 1
MPMPISIEAFYAPGCERCAEARAELQKLAEAVGTGKVVWRDVDVLADTARAVELGVLSPPAIAIDGVLVFPTMPTPARFREEPRPHYRGQAALGQREIDAVERLHHLVPAPVDFAHLPQRDQVIHAGSPPPAKV